MALVALVDHPTRTDVVVLVDLDDDGTPGTRSEVALTDLPGEVARRESAGPDEGGPPRWVWDDTARRYPPLLAAGVRVARCHDLRLCHTILRRSALCAGSALAQAPYGPWDEAAPGPSGTTGVGPVEASLFDDLPDAEHPVPGDTAPGDHRVVGTGGDRPVLDVVGELGRQLTAVAGSTEPGRLRLLLAAESTGALIAAELHHDGLPWDVTVHDALLTDLLGERPAGGGHPARLAALAERVRTALDQPGLNLDSQPHLLHALRLAGLDVASTSKWELRDKRHPVVEPLLEYKKLSRLLTANGWAWMSTWVHDGRFRPEYVVGGVVTGRWATSGGGALQLPAAVRGAVRADPGWSLVVADAAQLEPRVLAAMSADGAMAAAARHADLYQGVVDSGIVATRKEAKYAMLGAIYGATTGPSAVLMPRLTQAYPRAIALVEDAARAGERGDVVHTWLGRTSPKPDDEWRAAREAARGEGADAEQVRHARRRSRDWGRFTRNFVVQGTAAEWALCWMASLRRRLRELENGRGGSGLPGAAGDIGRPHLVFFLHDEVIVHTPAELAPDVADAVRAAADEAGRLLFGDFPVEFALSVSTVDSYDRAK